MLPQIIISGETPFKDAPSDVILILELWIERVHCRVERYGARVVMMFRRLRTARNNFPAWIFLVLNEGIWATSAFVGNSESTFWTVGVVPRASSGTTVFADVSDILSDAKIRFWNTSEASKVECVHEAVRRIGGGWYSIGKTEREEYILRHVYSTVIWTYCVPQRGWKSMNPQWVQVVPPTRSYRYTA